MARYSQLDMQGLSHWQKVVDSTERIKRISTTLPIQHHETPVLQQISDILLKSLDQVAIQEIIRIVSIFRAAVSSTVINSPILIGIILLVAGIVTHAFAGYVYTKVYRGFRQLVLIIKKLMGRSVSDLQYFISYLRVSDSDIKNTADLPTTFPDEVGEVDATDSTHQKEGIIVEPTNTPMDTAIFSSTLAEVGTQIDYYIALSDGPIEIKSASSRKIESEFVYIVTASELNITMLQSRLEHAYPDDYQIYPGSIIFPNHSMANEKYRPHHARFRSIEFKCHGTDTTADTLTPFAPAVEHNEQYNRLNPVQNRPLAHIFSRLKNADCTGLFHVSITNSDMDTNDFRNIAKHYENGDYAPFYKRHWDLYDDDKLGDSRTATKFDEMDSDHFFRIDPRFIVWGKNAKSVAKSIESGFDSIKASKSSVEGHRYRGHRAFASYRRALGEFPNNWRERVTSWQRSPQWRVQGFKALTRNQSTQFVTNGYALPHFVSIESTKEQNERDEFRRHPSRAQP